MNAKLFGFIVFLIPVHLFGQDYFVKNSNDTVFCHIDGIKSNKIFFKTGEEKSDRQDKINIYDCKSISVSDKSKIDNPQSIEILEAPKDEVLIYIIRPNNFINSGMNCRVKCNNLLLTALKNNSYCVLTLKPGEYEFYWFSRNKYSSKIIGNAGSTYFIKCDQTGGNPTASSLGAGITGSVDFYLSLLNNEIGEIALKQVKKESLKIMKMIAN